MDFGQALKTGFVRWADFEGRSSRSEYWWFLLGCLVISFLTGFFDGLVLPTYQFGVVSLAFTLITVIPSISVAVRRLHDIDRSGWWLLLVLTFIGGFVLIYWYCQPGAEGPNRFGPNPLAGQAIRGA